MRELATKGYAPAARALLERARRESRPQTLPFGVPVQDARAALAALNAGSFSELQPARSTPSVQCLQSALWLLFDCFPESHTLAQGIHTASGSYLHAIQHRREPDASNSKHWFSRVGAHPVFEELLQDARKLAGQSPVAGLAELVRAAAWDPDLMVKLCTGAQGPDLTGALLAIQRRELELLFDYEFRAAFE